jgi:preprotein translocase subunit SecD
VFDDKKVAEWVAYSKAEFGPVDWELDGLAKRLAGDTPEALVLLDSMNVTGQYLTSATKGLDDRGNPSIMFLLDREGARRFHKLTSQYVPNPATPNAHRRLGIILDKKLLSAPQIHSAISDRGMISGSSMTKLEVEHIVDILNAGALPMSIKLVDERRAAN